MIKRKLLQLAACGLLILNSLNCSWYDDKSISYTSFEEQYYSLDDEDLPIGCSDYIFISGYYFEDPSYGADEDADPDMRYAIPIIRLSQFAIDNPTDITVVNTAKCLMAVMDSMEIDHVYFMGELMSYDEAVEMREF